MGWDVLAYWVCFISGLAYALIAALLGGIFGFEHGGAGAAEGGFTPAAHDFGTDPSVGAGHGEAFAGAGPEHVAISPLSPMTIATFATVFGGTGLILTSMFGQSLYVTLPSAVVAGVAVAAGVFVLFYRVFSAVQASSEIHLGSLLGLPAEVTVAIPREGVGEIGYVALDGRYTGIARSESGKDIPRHQLVKISRVVGNTFYVTPVTPETPAAPPTENQEA